MYVKVKYYPQCTVHDLPLRCAAVSCVIVNASQRKPALSLYLYIFIYYSQSDFLIDAEALYTRLLLCLQSVCYDGSFGLLHADLHGPVLAAAAAPIRPLLSNMEPVSLL